MIASINQPISKIIESVAKTSSQKKKLPRYPLFTYDATMISNENKANAKQVRKYQKSSIDFGKMITQRSSMKSVYTVTMAIKTLHYHDSIMVRPIFCILFNGFI